VPFGVWTICFHSKDDLYLNPEHFRRCIREYKHSMTSLPAMVAAYGQRKISRMDRTFGGLWRLAIRAKVAMAAVNAPAPEIALEADADARQRLKAVP
jgi:hypothetical protein